MPEVLLDRPVQGPRADEVLFNRPVTPQWHFEVTARDIRRFRQAIGEDVDGSGTEGDEAEAPPPFCQAMAWRDVPAVCLPVDGAPVELVAGPLDARVVGGRVTSGSTGGCEPARPSVWAPRRWVCRPGRGAAGGCTC
jgi:hypothetical protein